MKKVLVALVCTLGAVACGESRPAEDPSARSTVVTTETTTNTGAPQSSTPATSPGYNAGSTAPANQSGSSATRAATPSNGASNATGSANTSGANAATGANDTTGGMATTGVAPAANNPGVANNTKDADNTKVNDRDRHGALTPMDQGGGKDRDITAAIRRAVVSDGALSFNAKNVKIITVGGKVTLRGPVKSDQEKTAIEAKAKSTAGVSEVDNQLEVKK